MEGDDNNIGRVMEGYVLEELIGEGFQAKAYKAKSESGSIAVVKLFKTKYSGDRNIEANAYSQIRHANVLQMISRGEEGNNTFIVLEYAGMRTLYDNFLTLKKFPADVARMVFRQIIEGLREVQSQDISHNDLHINNIFVANDYTIRIADFGKATGPNLVPLSSDDGSSGSRSRSSSSSSSSSSTVNELEKCDVFMCGFNLLTLVTGLFNLDNFTKPCEIQDKFFGNPAKFWEDLDKVLGINDLSDNFKNLIQGIMQKEKSNRLTVDQILAHPWMTETEENWDRYNQFFTKALDPISLRNGQRSTEEYRGDVIPDDRIRNLHLVDGNSISWRPTRFAKSLNPDVIYCVLREFYENNGTVDEDDQFLHMVLKSPAFIIHTYLIQGTGQTTIVDIRLIKGDHEFFGNIFKQASTLLERI